MMYFYRVIFLSILIIAVSGCMRWDYGEDSVDFDSSSNGLFILNEGNFQYGNATLSYYDPYTQLVENEVFYRANGMKLGDVAQSMTIYDGKGWIVVNNSHVVFAINLTTFKEEGRIGNLTSPRYIHFINEDKAYVTQLWDNRIYIVNPSTYSISGYIEVPEMPMGTGSTEQMVQYGQYVFCNCWSYQNRIIKIDAETDRIVDSIEVGLQPNSIVIDKNHNLWTICDGGYEGSPFGYETPALYCIDSESMKILRVFPFQDGDTPSEIQINKSGDMLFWVNKDIWRMGINEVSLPELPFIENRSTKYYGLTISPYDEDVYVADAIDYMQQGMIYRFSARGELIDSFYAGVTPAAFCWK